MILSNVKCAAGFFFQASLHLSCQHMLRRLVPGHHAHLQVVPEMVLWCNVNQPNRSVQHVAG